MAMLLISALYYLVLYSFCAILNKIEEERIVIARKLLKEKPKVISLKKYKHTK
jgi:hypothetical protein